MSHIEMGQLSVENRTRADQFVADLESFIELGNTKGGSRFRVQQQNIIHHLEENRSNQNHDGMDIVCLPRSE